MLPPPAAWPPQQPRLEVASGASSHGILRSGSGSCGFWLGSARASPAGLRSATWLGLGLGLGLGAVGLPLLTLP